VGGKAIVPTIALCYAPVGDLPNQEQVLDSFDAELKDFNYGDLEQLDLKEGSNDEKEDGEMDISITAEVSDEVSV